MSMPSPKPCRIRTVTSIATFVEAVVSAAPMSAQVPAAARALFRPSQSPTQPWAMAPKAAPAAKTELMAR